MLKTTFVEMAIYRRDKTDHRKMSVNFEVVKQYKNTYLQFHHHRYQTTLSSNTYDNSACQKVAHFFYLYIRVCT